MDTLLILRDTITAHVIKVVDSCQPCIQEVETTYNDVKIVGIICGTIFLICTFLFIITLLWLRKKQKIRENVALFDINERNSKFSLDAEERRRKFIHEDEDRKRKFTHEDEDRAWKKKTEEENGKRKLSEEDNNSKYIASIRDRQLKALDKVIEKIDDFKDTDYQIWKELAKTIAELTKSINSK